MKNSANKITRRKVLQYGVSGAITGGLSAAMSLGGCSFKWGKKRKPNVLLIIIDTCRADRFSCLGYNRKTTPYIDSLASEGVIYKKAYSTCFWTLPSHASLFTGLYPRQAGATSETNYLPGPQPTLAKLLRVNGYDTAAFSCNSWVSKGRGFGRGFDQFHEIWRPENRIKIRNGYKKAELFAAEKISEWISRQNQTPFFLFVNLNCAHMPYNPVEPFRPRFLSSQYNREKILRASEICGMWAYLGGSIKLDKDDLNIMNDLYDGEIATADHCVKTIVESLKSNEMLDDTIVIVTSDHGENIGEHGMIDHLLSMYDTTLHIPLIIRYPGRLQAGSKNDDLVSLVDIAPTILDLCSIETNLSSLVTRDLSLANKSRHIRKCIFAENEHPTNGIKIMKSKHPRFDVSTIDCRMRAIRTKQHKFIWSIGKNKQLHDFKVDPDEMLNIINSEPSVTSKLERTLSAWMKQTASVGNIMPLESHDKESLDILRSLGYIT